MRLRPPPALLFAALLALPACGGPRSESAGAAPESSSHAPRTVGELERRATQEAPILFLGLDGADWQQLGPWIDRGALPNLAELRKESAWGELESEVPALSPLLWTSMLTGVSPLEHGILDFSRFSPETGRREPIGSEDRRAPAIWNALTWAGKRVDLLGLWATYPAERVAGVVVSDRLFGFLNVESEPPPGAISPPEREAWARERLAAAEAEVDLAALRSYLPWLTEAEYRAHLGPSRAYDHPISALRRILVETRLYAGLAESLLAEPAAGTDGGRAPADLTLLYLQGTDSIGHVFAPYGPPRAANVPEADFIRYRDVPERYFREVDALVGRLLRLAERRSASVVIASDHGFLWGEGRPDQWAASAAQTAARWHRSQGIWLIRAAGVPPGEAPRARLREVYPTLLALSGLPAATSGEQKTLAGVRPPSAPAFDYSAAFRELTERGAQDHAAGETTSSSRATTIDPRAAEEELAKLRALGYLGSGESERANPEVLAAGGDEATRTASAWNNAGLLLRGERRDAEARVAFERALRLEPGLAAAQWNLSELLEAAGETARADELLLGALAGGLPDGVAQVVVRARAATASGGLQRSLALLDRALAARPDAADLWLFRGRYRIELGSCAAARGDLEEASKLAPANSDVLATAALAALCTGDRAGAEAALRRALALAPRDERLRRLLAEIASGD